MKKLLYKMTYQERDEWVNQTGKPEIIYAYLNEKEVSVIEKSIETASNPFGASIKSVYDESYPVSNINSIELYKEKSKSDFIEMAMIVEKYVKSYKSDFYDYDVITLNYPKEDNFLWVVRDSGTWLIPESEVHNSSVVEHCLYSRDNHKYYKVNANDLQPHKIRNIEKYVAECKEQARNEQNKDEVNEFDKDITED